MDDLFNPVTEQEFINQNQSTFNPPSDSSSGTQTAAPQLMTDPGTQAMSYDGKTPDASKLYDDVTDEKQGTQQTISENGENADKTQNRGALDNFQNGGMDQVNPQAKTNIPVEDPFGNYNNLSWDQTLGLSRLVDAYNNQRHWTPGNFNADGTGAISQYVQNEPIQTEETRRGEIVRQGIGQQQAYSLGRANEALSYPLELTKMFDRSWNSAQDAAMELRRNYADMVQRARFDSEYRDMFRQALQKDIQRWTIELGQYEDNKVARALWNEFSRNPQYIQFLAGVMTNGVMPQVNQYYAQEIVNDMMRTNPEIAKDPQKALEVIMQYMNTIGNYTARMEGNAAVGAATATIGGSAGK